METFPARLNRNPIVEALFELRFESATDSLANLLPGMLYPDLKQEFPKAETLPHAMLPKEIQRMDPSLQFKAMHRLVGDGFVIMIGDSVISLNCVGPYVGWANFREKILKIAELLKNTNLFTAIHRFSLKYVNLLTTRDGEPDLGMMNMSMSLGTHDLVTCPTQVRTEIDDGNFLNIIQLIPATHIKNAKGLLFDIDTISNGPFNDFWDQLPSLIDKAHETEKRLFFSMLTPQTLERFEPVWR